MLNSLLYITTLLVWGGSWLAIKWQGGEVPTSLSILYRFGLSAALLVALVLLWGRLQPTNRRDQAFCLLQGGCLFSCNFIAFYLATEQIASGLVAVVMSTATLFNAAHNWLIWRQPPSRRFKWGALLGVSGLALLFADELRAIQAGGDAWQALSGIGYALLGTWLFSLGNMIGTRHARHGLQPLTSNCWAMLYGCLILLLIVPLEHVLGGNGTAPPVWWDSDPRYLGALLYLAVLASVVGFNVYLLLVARIGANNAAYTLVGTPVIALLLSSLFEGYRWSGEGLLGLVVILIGNLLVLGSPQALHRLKLRRLKLRRIHGSTSG